MESLRDKLSRGAQGKVRLLFAGQAGFFVLSPSGQRLGLDLCLSDSVERVEGHIGFKRLVPPPILPEEVRAELMVGTHEHWDHFDPDTLPAVMKANPEARLYASPDCRPLAEAGGIDPERMRYVKPGDVYEDGDFRLHFISCDHGSGAPDAVGLLLGVGGKRLLFVGDTCLREDYKEEYLSEGSVDVLILPINGKFGNLDARDAAKLSRLLQPKLTVPSHFGLFAYHGGRPDEYYDIMTREYPDCPFRFMAMGEETEL